MKNLTLLIAVFYMPLCNSCYYMNHMPVASINDRESKVIVMKVGERRKIMSKTVLTQISPGFMMGPVHQLKSSDPGVVLIEGRFDEPVAWARALAPGKANIQHILDDGKITPIVVVPRDGP